MFSTVWLAARLSFMSPQAAPPGLRKSFCRSVMTSAVRGRSIAMPGIGNAIVPPFLDVPAPVVTACGREKRLRPGSRFAREPARGFGACPADEVQVRHGLRPQDAEGVQPRRGHVHVAVPR